MTRIVPLVVLALILTACLDARGPAEIPAVRRWLLCDECVNGELDSVIALGPAGFEAMKRAVKGPPRIRIETMRRQAEAMYARIPSPGMSRERYVDRQVQNYITLYQSRAVVALRRMGTPQAHAVLVNALRPDYRYRADVRRLLGEAAGTQLVLVAGDSQHAPLGSALRIDPIIEVRDSLTGPVMSNVRVVFRVDSGGGRVTDSTRLTDRSGRARVGWRLGDSDSINVLTVVAAGRLLRVHALGHRPGRRIVFITQPGTAVRNQPMSPPAQIAIQDAWGATVTGVSGSVTAQITPLGIGLIQNLVNGRATFGGLRIPQTGTGYKLRVRMLGLAPAESEPFDVVP